MGILTRKQGSDFVISSDRLATDAPTSRAPKMRPSDSLVVWTGKSWSAVMADAKTFESLDDADDYVKANFSTLAGQAAATKPSIIQPVEGPDKILAAGSAAQHTAEKRPGAFGSR